RAGSTSPSNGSATAARCRPRSRPGRSLFCPRRSGSAPPPRARSTATGAGPDRAKKASRRRRREEGVAKKASRRRRRASGRQGKAVALLDQPRQELGEGGNGLVAAATAVVQQDD